MTSAIIMIVYFAIGTVLGLIFTTGENGDTYTEWCCTIIMLTLCWPVILPTQIVRTIVNNIQRKRRRAEWEHLEKERNNK